MSDGPKFNAEKHIARLREGAEQALSDALYLAKDKRIFLSLFAAHLAVEKAIKAHVVKDINDIPPFIHNLPKLAELARIELTEKQRNFLADLTFYNISGRYQESVGAPPPLSEVKSIIRQAKEMTEWLLKTL
jgi:HEPN domain-containing protein